MATIIALDSLDGALLAGDRLVVEAETVLGTRPHVFDFDDVGAAAVGDDPDSFRRQLDSALREYTVEHGEPGIDAVSRMAAELTSETDVEALVVARDDVGRASVRSVDEGVMDERLAARGSGAAIVLGQLEPVGDVALDDAELHVRRAFRAAAARDAGTGEELDVWRLEDAESGETV